MTNNLKSFMKTTIRNWTFMDYAIAAGIVLTLVAQLFLLWLVWAKVWTML